MTPELRAALEEALDNRQCLDHLNGDGRSCGPYCRMSSEIGAIAPIIDAAITDAELQIMGKLSEIHAISERHALALNTRYALLAAADDLEAATFPDRVPEPGQIADWLRARANEGNPQ